MAEVIEVRGGPLAVEVAGEGRPFLWGHGLTSSRAHEDQTGLLGNWEWPEGGVKRVRYDARGHGESPGPQDPAAYQWDELALDQLAVADTLGIDRYVAGGASMGAATALHAAGQQPERIEALVLVILPTAWETRPAQRALYESGAAVIEEQGLEAFADLSAAAPLPAVFADLASDWAEMSRQRALSLDEASLPWVLRGAGASDLSSPEAVAAIDVPVLVLAWPGDPGHPVSTAERVAELLPQADLHVAADFEAVLGWADLIRAFVLHPHPVL